MTLKQFYTYNEQTFDSFMNKLIKNEGRDARKEISRRAKHEVAMSQLMESETANISITDSYDMENITFEVNGITISVNDMLLGQAIAALPPKRRNVILLSYFLNKNDPQIGTLLNLTSNTIRYRRKTALQRLKRILEGSEHEK